MLHINKTARYLSSKKTDGSFAKVNNLLTPPYESLKRRFIDMAKIQALQKLIYDNPSYGTARLLSAMKNDPTLEEWSTKSPSWILKIIRENGLVYRSKSKKFSINYTELSALRKLVHDNPNKNIKELLCLMRTNSILKRFAYNTRSWLSLQIKTYNIKYIKKNVQNRPTEKYLTILRNLIQTYPEATIKDLFFLSYLHKDLKDWKMLTKYSLSRIINRYGLGYKKKAPSKVFIPIESPLQKNFISEPISQRHIHSIKDISDLKILLSTHPMAKDYYIKIADSKVVHHITKRALLRLNGYSCRDTDKSEQNFTDTMCDEYNFSNFTSPFPQPFFGDSCRDTDKSEQNFTDMMCDEYNFSNFESPLPQPFLRIIEAKKTAVITSTLEPLTLKKCYTICSDDALIADRVEDIM